MDNEKPKIALTYTFRYVPIEDRIRMFINYDNQENRIDYMLTRKIVIDLIKGFSNHIEKNYSRKNRVKEKLKKVMEKKGIEIPQLQGNEEKKEIPTTKTKEEELNKYKEEPKLLTMLALDYLKENNATRLIFIGKNEEKTVGILEVEGLEKVVDTIKKNIPKYWDIGDI